MCMYAWAHIPYLQANECSTVLPHNPAESQAGLARPQSDQQSSQSKMPALANCSSSTVHNRGYSDNSLSSRNTECGVGNVKIQADNREVEVREKASGGSGMTDIRSPYHVPNIVSDSLFRDEEIQKHAKKRKGTSEGTVGFDLLPEDVVPSKMNVTHV